MHCDCCRNCTDREVTCHISCEKYRKYLEDSAKEKEKRIDASLKRGDYVNHCIRTSKKQGRKWRAY